jgi:phosphoenolpyruvate-protein kinase (PTS system EI component)
VGPDVSEREAIRARMADEERRRAELSALRDEPGRTADGHHVEIAANIAAIQHLPAAVEAGGEGSGLVRTEFLFLGRTTAPTVDEQVGFYAEVLRAFPRQRVVFRTMDVGADKPLPFVVREPEENPALGVRGIRLSLERLDLFRAQLRALLRARASVAGSDAGRLAVMFPMVSKAAELVEARRILSSVAEEERIPLEGIEVGVMIEVPSAALGAGRLAAHADFLSIGTNDLLQYLFAADRLVGAVADLADVLEPDVLKVIRNVIGAGHAHGSWVGVCGEAAGDPTVAAALVGLGIDELSMTRVAIPEVKDALRKVTLDDCRRAVEAAIEAAGDASEARTLLEERLGTGL